MTERPILFSGPMVRAILDGRKTHTRRVVKPQPSKDINFIVHAHSGMFLSYIKDKYGQEDELFCPYGTPGDRLWVRETWCHKADDGAMVYNADGNLDSSCVHFAADGEDVRCVDGDGFQDWNKDGTEKSPWKPSIHMPRWASRITLEITGVRVERVQDIGEDDARAEGVTAAEGAIEGLSGHFYLPCLPHRMGFMRLWDSINAKRGHGWDLNSWVWVVEFRRVEP